MICLMALFIFAVLGIFSAKYRSLAKEAFRCVFLKMTFRPCDVELDTRIKSKVVSKSMRVSPKIAKFMYKRFEMLSWAFTILFFASMIYTTYSFYNLYMYGTCDPNSEVCPLSISSPACGCEGACLCSEATCESPEYDACEGNCTCQKEVCKGV